MAFSTEQTVREVVVGAIQAIAQVDLGFDLPNGNVHSYLLDYEHPLKKRQYLMASVGAAQAIRAWGVMVKAVDVIVGTGGLVQRTYEIAIEGYYDLGVDGSGINDLLSHCRKVAGALRNVGTSLYQTVDYCSNPSFDAPAVVASGIEKGPGTMLKARVVYQATKRNPDF